MTTFTVVQTRKTRKGADALAARWADQEFVVIAQRDGLWLIGRLFDESDPRHGLTDQIEVPV